MIDVGRDDHVTGGNFVAHQLGRQLLALGDEEHLFGHQPLRAKCICDMLVSPVRAASWRRLAIHSARGFRVVLPLLPLLPLIIFGDS
jgi:hypothetical protein